METSFRSRSSRSAGKALEIVSSDRDAPNVFQWICLSASPQGGLSSTQRPGNIETHTEAFGKKNLQVLLGAYSSSCKTMASLTADTLSSVAGSQELPHHAPINSLHWTLALESSKAVTYGPGNQMHGPFTISDFPVSLLTTVMYLRNSIQCLHLQRQQAYLAYPKYLWTKLLRASQASAGALCPLVIWTRKPHTRALSALSGSALFWLQEMAQHWPLFESISKNSLHVETQTGYIFRFIEFVGKLLYKHVQPHESMESFGISWVSMFSLGVLALSTRLSPEKVFCTVTYSVLLSQTPLPCLSHTKCFMACWLARSYRNMGNVRRLNKPEYTVYKWLMYYTYKYTAYSSLALYLTPRNSHSSYGPGNHMQGPFSTRRAPVSVSSTDTYSSEKTLRL